MIFILLLMILFNAPIFAKGEKILHLTFHQGCKKEFESVSQKLGLELETWFIPDLPPKFFDGTTQGNALYNMGHDRAERIWNLHKEYFKTFDIILISDTSPLSRIFLQNNSEIPLMIWICNRFDYSDQASLDCDFPDEEYYQLFKDALTKDNVRIFAYNSFEHTYAKIKGIDTGKIIITPCAPKEPQPAPSIIPENIQKPTTFFLPPYHNERFYMNLSQHLNSIGIPAYCGRYNGPYDLKDFKGIIHLPYAWSNLALFENINLGIPYFIPSQNFFLELANKSNYFHPELSRLTKDKLFADSEWYSPSREHLFIYFESWNDLIIKIQETDFHAQHEKVKNYAAQHREHTLKQWEEVILSLTQGPQ